MHNFESVRNFCMFMVSVVSEPHTGLQLIVHQVSHTYATSVTDRLQWTNHSSFLCVGKLHGVQHEQKSMMDKPSLEE